VADQNEAETTTLLGARLLFAARLAQKPSPVLLPAAGTILAQAVPGVMVGLPVEAVRFKFHMS
jgi:hypothetical protein